jgi:hypothetical protein
LNYVTLIPVEFLVGMQCLYNDEKLNLH